MSLSVSKSPATMDLLLKAHYRSPGVPESYAGSSELKPAEARILSRLRRELEGASLLDIGVGAGRTAPGLRAAGCRYLGLDYSLPMLALCRIRFRDLPLVHCDAREVCLRPASLDAAFFWDALGDAGHEARMRMLREVRRVLRPGGWLIFRANNLDAPRRLPFAFPAGGTGRRGRLNALWRYLRGIAHHLRTRRYESRGGGWAVAGDPYFDYSLLSYYIRRDAQVRQLEDLGFSMVEVLGIDGTPLAGGGVCSDPFLFYIARRSW